MVTDHVSASWGWQLHTDPEAGRHWRPRARGVTTDLEAGFRFQGRTAALQQIVSWLDRNRTVPVTVTADAASDRSAPGPAATG